jgi:hypothetical protein
MGGAIFNQLGTVHLTNCTFSGNAAKGGGGGSVGLPNGTRVGAEDGSGLGGALFNLDGSVTLLNCTLASNTVVTPASFGGVQNSDGGAIYNLAYGNSFSTANTPVQAALTLTNTILADSVGPSGVHDLANDQPTGGPNTSGNTAMVTATDPNLIESFANRGGSGATITGTPLTADPKLGPLQNNGGPTMTRELLAGSPALNAGNRSLNPSTDQRGVARLLQPDLGAYQATASQLVVSGFPSPQRIGLAGSFTVTALDSFGKTAFGYHGTVSFQASVLATLPPSSGLTNGSGTFAATFWHPGVVTLSAGDGAIAGTEVVGVTGTLASQVVLKAVRAGKTFQLTAVVRGVPMVTPMGRVLFSAVVHGRRRVLGSAVLRGGRATLRSILPAGRDHLLAVYGGDGVYAGSRAAISVTVPPTA